MSDIPIYAISGERAVVSTGGVCTHGCEYCFVGAGGYKIINELSVDKIVSSVAKFPPEVKRIELGLDKDPMLDQPKALELISRLSLLGKDLSFATKANLTNETVKKLAEISKEMTSRGNYLFTKVSLFGFETAKKYEPHAPSPEERVEVIRRLHDAGLPTIIYIKPILPDLTDEEIERVFQETEDHCYAYIAGYLIYDEKLAKKLNIEPSKEKMKMEWDPSQREWNVYRDPRIKELVKRENVFSVSREAIEYVKNHFQFRLKLDLLSQT